MYHCDLLSDYLELRSTQMQLGFRRGLEELREIYQRAGVQGSLKGSVRF